ncbi:MULTISPECIES: hypothetical protein [Halorussus]|uniref:hypothetical protein n=1 Tax=Halorussus TaxID=1070314 RepID=UPI0020A05481|nr:hypothetical protein [Halorussus vallis]USZ75519.1 hypothetical protein NGM07_19065 [Halorussus vallis]
MREQVDSLVDELRAELGEDLHGVFYGNLPAHDYTLAYLHDDVHEGYSPNEILDLVDTVVGEQLAAHDHDELTHLLGEVQVTVRAFERAAHVVAWDADEEMGVFVGVAPDPAAVGATVGALAGADLDE